MVDLPAGASELCVLVRCRYFSRHSDGSGGGLATRVGIDPTAGTEYDEDRIAWGSWIGQDTPGWDGSTWRTASVELERVPGTQVTIWLESRTREKARDNHTWWDDVRVSAAIEGPVPDPDPDDDEVLELLRELLASARQIETDVRAICENVEAA